MYTPDNTELREKELETETEQLRKKLIQVQSKVKCANDHLQQKEKEHKEKNKKNVELMKKYIQGNDRLREFCTNVQQK